MVPIVPDFDDFYEDDSQVQLRDYQQDAVEKILAALETHRAALVVQCTGLGKSVLAGALTKVFVRRGQRVMMLAHTDELIDQAREHLSRAMDGIAVAKEKAGEHATIFDRVVVGSVQSLRGDRLRAWSPNHFGLIIVDETDLVMAPGWRAILAHFTGAKTCGLTATPTRADKKNLMDVFDCNPVNYSLLKAVREGWLVRPVVHEMPLKIDLSKIESRAGDLAPEQVGHKLQPYLREIARQIQMEAADKTTLAFLPLVSTSEMLAAALCEIGVPAESISGDDPERVDKVKRFRSGQTRVACSPMLLTRGFDLDTVDCIVPLRATKILSLLMQILGRGTRPLREIVPELNLAHDAAERRAIIAASRKPHVTILDFLALTERHDLRRPFEIVAPTPEVAAKMKTAGDLVANEEAAERDLLESFEKTLRAESKKKKVKRTLDPFAIALAVGDEDALTYEATGDDERAAATPNQLKLLAKFGLNTSKVRDAGHASRLIGWIMQRKKDGLCLPRALVFLKHQGIDASKMTAAEAAKRCQERFVRFKSRTSSHDPQLSLPLRPS